jgi:LysM repeat protein
MKSFEFLSEAVSSSNIYTVKSGDSLQSITQTFDTTMDGILWQNPQFASANDIMVGSRLRVPGSGPGVSTGGASGNAKIALDFFMQQGWTPEQAAGIVANLQAESGQNLSPLRGRLDSIAVISVLSFHILTPRRSADPKTLFAWYSKPTMGKSLR